MILIHPHPNKKLKEGYPDHEDDIIVIEKKYFGRKRQIY